MGTGIPRNDIPDKVTGKYVYMQHVRVPGMLHGRVVRPRGQRNYGAGAKVLDIDETSIRAIPGARVLRKGDFVGVVAESEWDAVRAAQQLKVVFENRHCPARHSPACMKACARRKPRIRSCSNEAIWGLSPERPTWSHTTSARLIRRMRHSGRTARWPT